MNGELCGGKMRYESEARAKHVRNTRARFGTNTLRVYQCDTCYGWHLTKSKKGSQEAQSMKKERRGAYTRERRKKFLNKKRRGQKLIPTLVEPIKYPVKKRRINILGMLKKPVEDEQNHE